MWIDGRFSFINNAQHDIGKIIRPCGAVVFTLRREEGPFGVELTVEDTERLLEDLPEQIRIASGKNA